FLLYCYGDPRVLQSFPTRRSSDLWYARAGDPHERGRCLIGMVDSLMYAGRYGEALRAAARGRRLLARAGDRLALARLANNEGNIDRKSTRLNSSHEWISYAVFCLK